MHLILLGAPGAGKGTQSSYLKEQWGLTHISTGDILRAEVRQGTELGKEAKGYMERGELVPDALIIKMMEERLRSLGSTQGYILDGFPRTVDQAEALTTMLEKIQHKLDAVVDLEVKDDELIRRLTGRRVCPKCGAVYHVDTMPSKVPGICDVCGSELIQRADDQIDAIRNRLDVYKSQTQPLIDYYRNQGKLITIDGTIGVPQVAESIHSALCGGK
ncbi:MAG TPA: adenylate kinase [Armatimonadota bacterium]|nr:adenylate kinase [Armatimonadota bacterium]